MTSPKETTTTKPSGVLSWLAPFARQHFGIAVFLHRLSWFRTDGPLTSITEDDEDLAIKEIDDITKDPQKALAFAKLCVQRADQMEEDVEGEVHMLDTPKKLHIYSFFTKFSTVPSSLFPSFGQLNGHNWFRGLPLCFSPVGGEMPTSVLPPTRLLLEPDTSATDVVPVVDRSEQSRILSVFRVDKWLQNTLFGGYVQLGWSSVVRAQTYQEILDQDSGLLVRICKFATTSLHALDGNLTWVKIVDTKKQRVMFAAIGAGKHPLPQMDQINPVGGGIVLSTMFQTYVAALLHIDKIGGLSQLPPGGIGGLDLNSIIAATNKKLAWRRSILNWTDQSAIGVALLRKAIGGNTQADKD